ncbi:hypothetical protein [Sphingobacterium faecale]|uniref:Uncharacterized protein n=1 Tax=Sphingobacterium faecale TaxID=2803775 RepID=A0ABS1R5Q6_9SPHI|nr:hypothetical protein [Sphingobacterium faecale]MBL1409327.1 hypothetical protein [Sphingobacterium faecale]
MKPDPQLSQKSLNVVMVSYLLSGDYAITHSNPGLKKDTVTFSLDSRVSGLDSLSRWEFGHLLGVKKPYRKGLGGVLQFTGLANKNYYAIYTGTGWEFYTYERDKMSVYHLSEEPDIILQDLSF